MTETRFRATMTDGTTIEVSPSNPDYCRWDLTAARHGWPNVEAAPFLWMTFVVWSAAVRERHYEGTFEAFRDTDCRSVENLDTDDTTEDETTAPKPPTPSAAMPERPSALR